MNWHLYRKDDPNTWPEIDCPMLVYKDYNNGNETLQVHYWDKDFKQFYVKESNWYKGFDECYYQYIGYVPNGYKVHSPTLCDNEGHNSHLCDEYDNGYCMDRGYHVDCPYKIKWNEYEIETKRIWKEFE